jgi:carbon-monoxide dehydrogenase medium subunit
VTGVAGKAYRAGGVERALKGASLDSKTISAAAEHVAEGIEPNSDLFASGEYRRHLAQVYARRALETAASRAK